MHPKVEVVSYNRQHLFINAQNRSGDKVEHCTDDRKNGRDDDQYPVHDLLRTGNRIAEDLEMESEREDDADGEASNRAEQTHDAIELRD